MDSGYFTLDGLCNKRYFATLDDLISYHWAMIPYFKDRKDDGLRVLEAWSHQRIDFDIIYKAYEKKLAIHRRKFATKRYGNYKFRNGPVPTTGGSWRRKGRGCAPAHGIHSALQNKKFLRPKYKNKVADWDEWYYRNSERNWKSQRKTQYKVK